MDSPTKDISISFSERRSFLRNVLPPEVRTVSKILNKITNSTYDGFRDDILKIKVLKDDSTPEEDKENMKPIVKNFLNIIYEDTEANNTIVLYGKLFADICQKWQGNHGKVLLNSMIFEINNFLLIDYLEKCKSEEVVDDNDRRKCFCIVKFLHYLYNQDDNILPGKILMVITEKFFHKKEQCLEVLIRILKQNHSKLKNEKIFELKLKAKYLEFLKGIKNDTFSSKQFNYSIEELINSMN